MTDLKSFDASGVQFAWDATSLSSFSKCPRYYYYKHLEGWQPDNKSAHLIFGGLYAKALEDYAKYVAEGDTPDEATHKVVRWLMEETWEYDYEESPEEDEGIPGMARARGPHKRKVAGSGAPVDWMHTTKTRYTLVRSVVWYLDNFEDDPAKTVLLSSGKPAVEYSFAVPLEGEIIYCGHLDKLVTYDEDYFVMDQKTTGTTVTARYFDGFSPDFQMSGYSFAGKILFDLPISGVIIDAAQIAVGFTRFTRGFAHRSAQVLDDWYVNTLRVITLAQQAADENSFPMNYASCGNYGGCEFRKICSRAPQHREALLHADFVRKPRWDPLEQR